MSGEQTSGIGERVLGSAPAALLALFGLWMGTMWGGATAAGAAASSAAVLLAAVGAGGRWRDPLALGRAGRLLPWALWVAVAASAWASPVARAGLLPALLLPAYLLLPAAVARAWSSPVARRWGVETMTAVTGVVALWSLVGRLVLGDPRAAAPLGHHLLLGVFLLAIWPFTLASVVGARGTFRAVSLIVWMIAIGAVVCAGSLAVWTGLLAQCAVVAVFVVRRGPALPGLQRRVTAWLFVGLAAALATLALVRLDAVAGGSDPSARARTVYLHAGLAGLAERPLLGWGAGSVPWTLAAHLRPEPAVNPPSEMVAELHALPFQLAYELGLPATGLVVTIGWLFLLGRRRDRTGSATATDPGFVRIGLLGLLGAGVASLATGWWAVTAVPVALATCCGAVLAGSAAAAGPGHRRQVAPRGGEGAQAGLLAYLPVALYVFVVALALTPYLRAQQAYDRAALASDPRAVELGLAEAVARDPDFPWYRLVAVWTSSDVQPDSTAAREALEAAEDGYAIAPLWLVAGVYGGDRGEPWAAAALERGCRLDPLGALAPFYRLALEPTAEVARSAGARALLAEPRLAASTLWEKHPGLLGEAVAGVLAAEGVDPGWREALAARVAETGEPGGAVAELGLQVEPLPAESMALRVFRRRPWPLALVPVPLRAAAAERFDLPAANVLSTTDPAVFSTGGCALGEPSG